MNIVNQLFDLADVPVDKRQSINDLSTDFVNKAIAGIWQIKYLDCIEQSINKNCNGIQKADILELAVKIYLKSIKMESLEHSELKELFAKYADKDTGFISATPEQVANDQEDLESWEKQDLVSDMYGFMNFYEREFEGDSWKFVE